MTNQTFQMFLSHFYLTEKGSRFLKEEQALLSHSLNRVFGYFIVQIGKTTGQDLLKESRINFKVLVDQSLPNEHANEYIQADIDYLPFKKESIDAVFIPHTLEAVSDPYHLLRQIDKMILAEGHLIITGFNPLGSQIVSARFGEYRREFKQAHFIKESRVIDWLNLLGYDIECVHYQNKNKNFFLSFLKKIGIEFGSVYLILAKKRVESQTPVGLNWRLSNWLPVKKGQAVANHTIHKKEKECK